MGDLNLKAPQRTIVRFTREGTPEGATLQQEFPAVTAIGVNPAGAFVLLNGDDVVGMFPIHAIAGIFHPDGPNQVVLGNASLTSKLSV